MLSRGARYWYWTSFHMFDIAGEFSTRSIITTLWWGIRVFHCRLNFVGAGIWPEA
jgi:hypothetical protein